MWTGQKLRSNFSVRLKLKPFENVKKYHRVVFDLYTYIYIYIIRPIIRRKSNVKGMIATGCRKRRDELYRVISTGGGILFTDCLTWKTLLDFCCIVIRLRFEATISLWVLGNWLTVFCASSNSSLLFRCLSSVFIRFNQNWSSDRQTFFCF